MSKDINIKFSCLKEKCKKSCCGQFKGFQNKLVSVFGLGFSEIPLTKENVEFIKKINQEEKIYFKKEIDLWFIKLNRDTSCPFFHKGLCSIQESKPPICKAYPFYLDPCAGLSIDKSCPGVKKCSRCNQNFDEEFQALKEAYRIHFSYLD